MSEHERHEKRDRGFSNWHRYACAKEAKAIDIDLLEYCQRCRAPLLIIESARDALSEPKSTIVIQRVAEIMGIPAILVLWTPSAAWREEYPHCSCQQEKRVIPGCDHGIGLIRWRFIRADLHPRTAAFKKCSPAEFADRIDRLHQRHRCAPHMFNDNLKRA